MAKEGTIRLHQPLNITVATITRDAKTHSRCSMVPSQGAHQKQAEEPSPHQGMSPACFGTRGAAGTSPQITSAPFYSTFTAGYKHAPDEF